MIRSKEQEIPAGTEAIVRAALAEDIGEGDVTTRYTVPEKTVFTGRILAKENGVIAGLEVVRLAFSLVDEQVQLKVLVADGEQVSTGQVVATIRGPGRGILSGERVALNFLQRMSGIATTTHRFVQAVAGTGAIILDTRKTAPGLRLLDKWAVRLGGGQNHRFGLYDMVLIKENHITAAGGIARAVQAVHNGSGRKLAVEVEVRDLAELQQAMSLEVDRILLDNMSLEEMREAVRLVQGRLPLEASGNVTLETVAAIAATGVGFISVGLLTHSVKALDVSLLLDSE